MRWRRVSDPYGIELPNSYEWNDWLAVKSFYADGPSLFVWVLYGPTIERLEFGTLREAKAFAEAKEVTK